MHLSFATLYIPRPGNNRDSDISLCIVQVVALFCGDKFLIKSVLTLLHSEQVLAILSAMGLKFLSTGDNVQHFR